MLAQALRSDPAPQAVADASALQHFDSSALAVLLECRREALALGKSFAVSRLPERLRELAALYGVAELLPVAAA
jgi:phospholipid transport system transporter-binding protein